MVGFCHGGNMLGNHVLDDDGHGDFELDKVNQTTLLGENGETQIINQL